MKISRVEATYLTDIPIAPPPLRDEPSSASLTIVEIETEDGIVGYGKAGGGASTVDFINRRAAAFLKGQNPFLTERIWARMVREFAPRGPGAHGSALSALDIALWDIKGKALGEPVWQLIGGAQNPVEAYISFGLGGPNTSLSMVPAYTVDELVEEATLLVEQGHTKLKTGVGRSEIPNPDEDAARMGALREALGPDVKLLMDGGRNMAFHDALRLCKLCEPHHITFFEEPVPGNDPRLLAELRKKTSVPLAANPAGYRSAYRELLLHDAVDFLQPNVASIGYTEACKVAEMAQAFHRFIANGNGSGPHNMHLQAGMSNGWGVEFHYHNWMVYRAVYPNLPEPQGGWLTLPDTPGIGLDPDPEVIKAYRSEQEKE